MIGINYELFDIYIYTHTHSNSTLKNFIWTKSLKLIKQPCDSPYYINWGFSLPVNFLSSPITFFFFFLSRIYTVLQLALATLSPYYINWCVSLPVNFLSSPITFFFLWDIYGFSLWSPLPPPPFFFC